MWKQRWFPAFVVLPMALAGCIGGDNGRTDTASETSRPTAPSTNQDEELPGTVPGEVIAQLRRPAGNMRWDGRHLYATGAPFTLVRIDPATGEVDELPFGGEFGAAHGRYLGLTVTEGEVAALIAEAGATDDRLITPVGDTGSFRSTMVPASELLVIPASIDDVPIVVGLQTADVARIDGAISELGTFVDVTGVRLLTAPVVHGDSVWIAAPEDGAVLELDRGELSVRRRIDVAALGSALTVHGGSLWVGHGGGPAVTQIDLDNGTVLTETALLPDDDRAAPSAVEPVVTPVGDRLFARAEYLWEGASLSTIVEIDPESGAVIARRTVGARVMTMLGLAGDLLVLDASGRLMSVDLDTFASGETDDGLPLPGPLLFEPTDDERAVMEAFTAVYDPTAGPDALAGVAGGEGLEGVHAQAFSTLAELGVATFRTPLAVVEGDQAWVTFVVLDADGQSVFDLDNVATLIRADDQWMVPRAQFCGDLALIGITCPAPDEP